MLEEFHKRFLSVARPTKLRTGAPIVACYGIKKVPCRDLTRPWSGTGTGRTMTKDSL